MADALVHQGAGIVEMDGTNSDYILAENKQQYVDNVFVTGDAAGTYTFTVDGASMSITTTATILFGTVPLARSVNSVVVSAVATGGKVFLLLRSG